MLSNTLTKSTSPTQLFKDYQWAEIPNTHTNYNSETQTLSWESCENTSLYKVSIYPPNLSKNPSNASETVHYTHLTTIGIALPSDGSTYKVRHNELLVAIEANVSTEILVGSTSTLDLRKHSNPTGIGEVTDVLIHQVFPVKHRSTSDSVLVVSEGNLLKIQAGDATKTGHYYFKCILQYQTEKSLWTIPCSVTLEVSVC